MYFISIDIEKLLRKLSLSCDTIEIDSAATHLNVPEHVCLRTLISIFTHTQVNQRLQCYRFYQILKVKSKDIHFLLDGIC